MLYLFYYGLYFLVPGWLIHRLVANTPSHFVVVFAWSYVFIVCASLGGALLGLGVSGFLWLLNGSLAVLAALVIGRRGRGISRPTLVWPRRRRGRFIVIALSLLVAAGYVLLVGPYTEIPSDVWWHLGRMQIKFASIQDGLLFRDLSNVSLHQLPSLLLNKFMGYWHTFHALLSWLSGLSIEASLPWVTLTNTVMLAAATFSFTVFVFKGFRLSAISKYWIGLVTVVVTGLYLGIAQFAFIRYYILAPVALNYIVYLATVYLVLRFLQSNNVGWPVLVPIPFYMLTMAAVHKQEVLFAITTISILSLLGFLRAHRVRIEGWLLQGRQYVGGALEPVIRTRVNVLFAVVAVVYLVVHSWLYVSVHRGNPLRYNTLTSLSDLLPFLQNLYILRPEYQFYQVLTVWGLVVYALYIWQRHTLNRSLYLSAGMWLPVLTVFNPIFTDFFVRLASPQVLWRICWLVPIPLVAGYFLVTVFSRARDAAVGAPLVKLVAFVVLCVSWLPAQSTFFSASYSRLATLTAVDRSNDYWLWKDLYIFLNTLEPRRVITDRVTGYTINGLTSHRYGGYKFYGRGALPLDGDEYTRDQFRARSGWLLVVNKRDGQLSATGRVSRHWSERIMLVSRFYSNEFDEFVASNSDLFTPLWSQSGITVYEIHYRIRE